MKHLLFALSLCLVQLMSIGFNLVPPAAGKQYQTRAAILISWT